MCVFFWYSIKNSVDVISRKFREIDDTIIIEW